MESENQGIEAGPGIEIRSSPDIWPRVGLVFAVLGFIPANLVRIGGFHAFGPIAFTALFSIVAVLLGLVAILRAKEIGQPQNIRLGSIVAFLGVIRLLLWPMLGW